MSMNANDFRDHTRIGAGFSIFASSLVCLVIVLIILEQLGLDGSTIGLMMIVLPAAGCVLVGMALRTTQLDEFFTAGPRVAVLANGFAMAAPFLSGAGAAAILALAVFGGMDALAIPLGWLAGIALFGLALAPALRKAGAFTLPGFLALRFGSSALRLGTTVLLLPALVLLVAAELGLAAALTRHIAGGSVSLLLFAGAAVVAAGVVLGGARSLTWATTVEAVVLIAGLVLPLAAISIVETNLPVPQLTYGSVLEALSEMEPARGLMGGDALQVTMALPPVGASPLARPFAYNGGLFSGFDFAALALVMMLGAMAMPASVARAAAAGTATAARRAGGWALLIVALLALTYPAYAAFLKTLMLRDVLAVPPADWPPAVRRLQSLGLLVAPGERGGRPTFDRDGLALMLPVLANMPTAVIGMAAAALIAACAAAAGSHLVALGAMISNDLYWPFLHRSASPARRLLIARLGILLAAAGSAVVAADGDPLARLFEGFSLLAPVAPLLLLAVWWRGLTLAGTLAGLVAGASAVAALLAAGPGGAFGFDSATAGLAGAVLAALAAVAISFVSPRPDARIDELIDEMRLPGGETLHARLTRAAARGRAPRP